MATTGRIGFCIDEACGRRIAPILRELRAPAAPEIHDIRELNLGGASDEVLMAELARLRFAALVTLDSRILNAAIRRAAWQRSGLTLLVLDGKWGNLPLFDQAQRLIWWWPDLVAKVGDGPQGAAWRIAPDAKPSNIVRILPI